MTQKLNFTVLETLPEAIAKPGYRRADLTPGIVHIGVGNFHRAHQAVYLHRLFDLGESLDWAIVGAGLKPYDAAMRDRLARQDWLNTVVELDPQGLNAMICGAMIDFVDVDPSVLVSRLTDPAIRIVSLTITEGGYFVDPNTGGFDVMHPEIQADLKGPANPTNVFGVLVEALLLRKAAKVPPFTIMSCDNLPENGHITRQAIVGFAKARSEEDGDWIENHVACPSGMVDCITPATGDRERELVEETFLLSDAAPVVCEPFRQWVLEDNFPTGRPALEKVGVAFVEDVAPYELMKLRILNGGHAALAYPAALLGHHFVHDAMADPLIRGYLEKLEREEILPEVPPIKGVNFETYLSTVLDRFSNPAISDTVARLCLDGSNRQPKFILPTIRERLKRGASVAGLALELALWCRYCLGRDDAGNPLHLDDEKAGPLRAWAEMVFGTYSPDHGMPDLFGDLSSNAEFLNSFKDAVRHIADQGVAGTLTVYLDGHLATQEVSAG